MRLALLLAFLLLTGCAAGGASTRDDSAEADAHARVGASLPMENARTSTHEETATRSCASTSECAPPLTCCFSAPDGAKLAAGYCASHEMCDAVSAPAH